MKQHNKLLVGLGAGLLMASNGFAGTVVGSLHDLSGGTTKTDQVCVFCHTPHGAVDTVAIPLWNKALPSSTYVNYTSSTLDGTADIAGSVSLACLSCHDGTQAMDNVINKPGTGGYLLTGAELDAGAIGAMTGTPVPTLGEDLSNDHPVSVEYAGGGAVWGTAQGLNDADYTDSAFQAISYNATTDKMATATNSLPLYEKTVGLEQLAMVECASCHDPHNNDNGTFLRVSNAASAVCTSCHVK